MANQLAQDSSFDQIRKESPTWASNMMHVDYYTVVPLLLNLDFTLMITMVQVLVYLVEQMSESKYIYHNQMNLN